MADLLTASTSAFEAGRVQLGQGHLDSARHDFDQALDLLLGASDAMRADPRLASQLTSLIDRITALESAALASGDGFTEQAYEAASIDELLSDATTLELPPSAPPELEATVAADLGATRHDIDIPANPKVLAYVELFQGRLREWFQASLQRGASYLPQIQSVFKAEGVPLDLAFVPLVESAFKANALSRARARGFWQFMRGTGRENGLKLDWFVDERADPHKATLAAAKYFKTLADMFDGDWHLALASYNGGPGRVQRALRQSKKTSFWDLAASGRFLPRETREYVPMILAAVIIGRNPTQYGFDIDPGASLTYDTVTVDRAIDLRKVAEWTGAPIDEIQALNPELRRMITPAKREYAIKVPTGTATLLEEKMAEAPPTDLAAIKWHEVRTGETLEIVARRYGVRRADLADANDLSVRSKLKPGTELLIPRNAPAAVRSGPTRAGRPSWLAANGQDSAKSGKLVYKVRRGDTLGSIARNFDTTVSAIQVWNNLKSTRLMPGDQLTIFTTRSADQ
ncbi:MAG: LysM peptidoglycan-binding domain-containing protein [Vicinamibacterales bacterium]